jgi:hypothetical protein
MEPRDVGLCVVGEAAPQPAVGGRGWFSGGGPRAVCDQECECILCVCVCSPPRPLLLLLTGNGGFGALLSHCLLTRTSVFFLLPSLGSIGPPPPPPPVFRFSLSENKNVITRKSFHPFLQEVHDQQDNIQH